MNFLGLFFLVCCGLWAADSAEIKKKGVSKSDEIVILYKHNSARKSIEAGRFPGMKRGKNFKTLKYDHSLAKEAQKISDTCVFEHVDVDDDRWSVGQNLFILYSSAARKRQAEWNRAIQSWLDEAKDYTYGGDINSKNGHFTQVIWANTEYIGCGYTKCYDKSERFPYFYLYVCNYGPAGNYVGRNPYELA